jgi:predicted RNA binding protein YcfA (HicA-like mRNA interferase family)
MPKDIPPEDAARIAAFWAEEAANKKAKPDRESKQERKLRERLTSGTVFRPSELQSYALQQGWKPLGIEGSHQKFENEKGEIIVIPTRTGQQVTVQPDTAYQILRKIFPNIFKK